MRAFISGRALVAELCCSKGPGSVRAGIVIVIAVRAVVPWFAYHAGFKVGHIGVVIASDVCTVYLLSPLVGNSCCYLWRRITRARKRTLN